MTKKKIFLILLLLNIVNYSCKIDANNTNYSNKYIKKDDSIFFIKLKSIDNNNKSYIVQTNSYLLSNDVKHFESHYGYAYFDIEKNTILYWHDEDLRGFIPIIMFGNDSLIIRNCVFINEKYIRY